MIQESESGHSSVEDAIATMELFKLVQTEWERRCPDLAGADLMGDQFWPEDSSSDEEDDCSSDEKERDPKETNQTTNIIRKKTNYEEYSEEYI